ncbi:hypothetical protein BDW59DRAFT_155114 [Aspergillus cavernicola]|uniref:Uncharacterized protein n=1 Tax=Aspergillus cavernicola TaxID=176166 RepID=A0ABR4HBU7_9EURO
MLFNLPSTLLPLLLAVSATVSAAPVKRGRDYGDLTGVNIIPGLIGEILVNGQPCQDRLTQCHEICHVMQQSQSARDQCYDDCYKDTQAECQNTGTNDTGNGPSAGSGGSGGTGVTGTA